MFVILRTFYSLYKANGLSSALRYLLLTATAVAVLDFLGEEIVEQLTGILPVVTVDTVSHLGRLDSAQDESRVFELLEMLAHGSLGDGQLVVDVAKVTFLLTGQELQYLNPCGVGEGFGEARYLLRLEAIVFLRIHGFFICIYDKNL